MLLRTDKKGSQTKMHSVEQRLGKRKPEDIDLLPKELPISREFRESLTIDELAELQNVKPMVDVRALFGIWPDEEDDGFEEAVNELREL